MPNNTDKSTLKIIEFIPQDSIKQQYPDVVLTDLSQSLLMLGFVNSHY